MSCTHENIYIGYGFLRSKGLLGIGVYRVCDDCYELIEWTDDPEMNTEEEIEHNRKILSGELE